MTPNERQGAPEVAPTEAAQAGHQAPASPAAPSPEEWRPVVGWEGLYEVSSLGRVRSLARVVVERGTGTRRPVPPRILKDANSRGYRVVGLAGRGRRCWVQRVHSLMAAAFIGPRPPRHDVRHLDGNRSNNALENLAYGSRAENMADAVRHGRTRRGEGSPAAKLSTTDVRAARVLRSKGATYGEIARGLGVSPGTVRDACIGVTWNHLV